MHCGRDHVECAQVDLLNVTVMGDPIPKGRPRGGRGHHYTPKRTRDAEEALRELAGVDDLQAWEGPVGIDVTFFCATRRRTDGDNLTKLVTDALQRRRGESTGGVFLDDAQIEDWRIRVRRRVEGEEPRTEIRVYTL